MTETSYNRKRGWENQHMAVYISKDTFDKININVGSKDEHIRSKIDFLYEFYRNWQQQQERVKE